MRLHIVTDLLNILICILHITGSSTHGHCDDLCSSRQQKVLNVNCLSGLY